MTRRRLEDIHIGLLDTDPDNARKTFTGIEMLARSIEEIGLLENLVVVQERGRFRIKAGERRYRAIKLLHEASKHSGTVSCLVLRTDGEFEGIAENVARHAVFVWEMGQKYDELIGRGYTQEEIADKVGVQRTTVSQYIRIARGLCERVTTILSRMPSALSMAQLEKLATLIRASDLEPDEKSQLRALDDFLSAPGNRKKRAARDLGTLPLRERLYVRYRSLKYQISIPVEAREQVDAVLAYMDGSTKKLNLKPFGVSE